MHVDDVVEAIFQHLCIRQADGAGSDKSMGLTELRLAVGVTEPQMNEARSRSRRGAAAAEPLI